MECDFGHYSMEWEMGGHKNLKLKRLQRHEKKGETLASQKPMLSHSPPGINFSLGSKH